MLCISCGNNLKVAHKFCGSCGAKVNSNLTNPINNSPQSNIVAPLEFDLPTIPIEISKVKIEGPDTDNSYTVTVSSNFTNSRDEDWDFLQIKTHLLNSNGLIIRENIDTVEEHVEANGTYAHESVFWGIPAPSLGTSPENVIVVVSALASKKYSLEFEELNLPSSSFELSKIASTCLIGPALKLISGSMWKTQPDDDKESAIEINFLFQNLGKVILPDARLVGDILDKKGKVLSEVGNSKEVLPGELTQLIGYGRAKETKLAGAKLKFSLITFYPVAAAVEQQNGAELVADESNDVPWPFEDIGSEQDDIIDIEDSENSASTKSFEWSMKLGEINMDDVEEEEVLSALKKSLKLAKAKKFEDAVNALPHIDFEYSFSNLDSDASDYFSETEGISFGLDPSNSKHTIQVGVSGGKLNLSVTVVFDIPVKDGVNLAELNEWLGDNGGYAAGFASGGWSYNGDEGGHIFASSAFQIENNVDIKNNLNKNTLNSENLISSSIELIDKNKNKFSNLLERLGVVQTNLLIGNYFKNDPRTDQKTSVVFEEYLRKGILSNTNAFQILSEELGSFFEKPDVFNFWKYALLTKFITFDLELESDIEIPNCWMSMEEFGVNLKSCIIVLKKLNKAIDANEISTADYENGLMTVVSCFLALSLISDDAFSNVSKLLKLVALNEKINGIGINENEMWGEYAVNCRRMIEEFTGICIEAPDGVDYEEDAYFDSVDWDIVAEKIVQSIG